MPTCGQLMDHFIAFRVNNCFMDCFRTILLIESSIFFCNLSFVQIFPDFFKVSPVFERKIGSLSSTKHVISEVQSDLFPSSLFLESFTQKTKRYFFSKLRQESRDMSELKKLKSRERDLVKQLKSFTQVWKVWFKFEIFIFVSNRQMTEPAFTAFKNTSGDSN